MRNEQYTNAFMSPRGDNGIQKQAQQPTPGKIFGNNSSFSAMAYAMPAIAAARQAPQIFANGPIKMNASNKQTGRVIS